MYSIESIIFQGAVSNRASIVSTTGANRTIDEGFRLAFHNPRMYRVYKK
jgi:hypothetical protein